MHYYQFNIGDYKSHTDHLEPIEDIAYRRMIDHCYLHEEPLPKDIGQIARLIRMRSHTDSIAIILDEFFCEKENGFLCKRVTKDIKAFKEKSVKAKKSAEARWKKKPETKELPLTTKQCEPDANALRSDSDGNANHKPLTTNHKPVIKDICRFAEFWNLYAKKTDLKKCEAKFKKLTKANVALIFEKLPAYIKSTSDKQFRKNPITWLNNESWNDEIQSPTGQHRNINDIGTDFSAPSGFNKMIFKDGEHVGYE